MKRLSRIQMEIYGGWNRFRRGITSALIRRRGEEEEEKGWEGERQEEHSRAQFPQKSDSETISHTTNNLRIIDLSRDAHNRASYALLYVCTHIHLPPVRCNLNPIPGGDYNVVYYPESSRIFPSTTKTVRRATWNKEIVISRDTVRQISLPTCQPLVHSAWPSFASPRKLSISGYIASGQQRVRAIQQRRLYWALFLEPGGGRRFFLLFPKKSLSLL